METKFTEQESLTLISEMIEQARNNFQKGSGNAMILNGCAVAFIALLNILLLFILPNPVLSFNIWWLMLPVMFVDRLIDKRQHKDALVKTHIDKIITAAWRSFSIAIVVFLITIFAYGIAQDNPRIFVLITPTIMLMAGATEFITAKACRFKPFLTGAWVLWGGTLACPATYILLHYWSGILHFLILAVCMVLAFVIPGYRLNKLAKSHV